MRDRFNFKSLRLKMMVGFATVLFFVFVYSVFNSFSVKRMNDDTAYLADDQVPLLIANEKMAFNAAQRMATIRGYLMFEEDQYLDLLDGYNEESEVLHEQLLETSDADEIDYLVGLSRKWTELIDKDVIAEHQNGNVDGAIRNVEKHNLIIREVMNAFGDLALAREVHIEGLTNKTIAVGRNSFLLGIGLSVFVLILGILVANLTSRSIVRPVQMVMERMNAIAVGKLNHEPLETTLRDEVGQLVVTTNQMNENMRDAMLQVSEVSEIIDRQSNDLNITSNEVSEGAEQIAATMQELASGSETEANHASALSSKMVTFADKVESANNDSMQIEQASNDVMRMTADGMKLMKESIEQMHAINQMVQTSVTDVEGLDEQSKQISNLVSVIQDIAEQTNLLALNAAIEAARAGEQGHGFAVVAEEVRTLAEGVSDSVTDITGIVDGIQSETKNVSESLQSGYEEVERGTEQLERTETTFNKITEFVNNMIGNITNVSTHLNEINEDSQEMDNSIEEIAAISEESAAGIQETTASTEETNGAMFEISSSADELSNLVVRLNDLISRFEI